VPILLLHSLHKALIETRPPSDCGTMCASLRRPASVSSNSRWHAAHKAYGQSNFKPAHPSGCLSRAAWTSILSVASEKRVKDQDKIDETLERFDRGEVVSVDDLNFIPHTADLDVDQDWDAEIAIPRGYLSIAFLFLCLIVGDRIKRPALDPIRRVLLGTDTVEDGDAWTVTKSHYGRDSELWHRIEVVQGEPNVAIDITLFGQWLYRVSFNDFPWLGDRFGMWDDFGAQRVYYKNLDSSEPTQELIAEPPIESAK
jgi:hypothetical protein